MARQPPDAVLVGRYKLSTLLGTGSMGEVYLARDMRFDRPVAIKFLSPDAERLEVRRFFAEAAAQVRLRHPHVVQVLDFSQEPEPFIVFEYVEGETLRAALGRHAVLSVEQALVWGSQLCDAMECAHAAGIVHRDLKPENLLLTQAGDLKVTDFGLARRCSAEATLTTSGTIVGTPAYMAPERIRSDEAGPPSDVYAAGCILFELLEGRPPFHAPSLAALLRCHLDDPPPAAGSRRPDVTPALAELVAQCLAKEPAARPRGFDEVRARLEGCRSELEALATTDGPPRAALARSRSRPSAADQATARSLAPVGRGERSRAAATVTVPAGAPGPRPAPARARWPLALAGAVAVGAAVALLSSGWLGPSPRARLPRRPWADSVRIQPEPTGALVSWKTSDPQRCRWLVREGAPGSGAASVVASGQEAGAARDHQVRVPGLRSAAPYTLTLVCEGDEIRRPFATQPEPADGVWACATAHGFYAEGAALAGGGELTLSGREGTPLELLVASGRRSVVVTFPPGPPPGAVRFELRRGRELVASGGCPTSPVVDFGEVPAQDPWRSSRRPPRPVWVGERLLAGAVGGAVEGHELRRVASGGAPDAPLRLAFRALPPAAPVTGAEWMVMGLCPAPDGLVIVHAGVVLRASGAQVLRSAFACLDVGLRARRAVEGGQFEAPWPSGPAGREWFVPPLGVPGRLDFDGQGNGAFLHGTAWFPSADVGRARFAGVTAAGVRSAPSAGVRFAPRRGRPGRRASAARLGDSVFAFEDSLVGVLAEQNRPSTACFGRYAVVQWRPEGGGPPTVLAEFRNHSWSLHPPPDATRRCLWVVDSRPAQDALSDRLEEPSLLQVPLDGGGGPGLSWPLAPEGPELYAGCFSGPGLAQGSRVLLARYELPHEARQAMPALRQVANASQLANWAFRPYLYAVAPEDGTLSRYEPALCRDGEWLFGSGVRTLASVGSWVAAVSKGSVGYVDRELRTVGSWSLDVGDRSLSGPAPGPRDLLALVSGRQLVVLPAPLVAVGQVAPLRRVWTAPLAAR